MNEPKTLANAHEVRGKIIKGKYSFILCHLFSLVSKQKHSQWSCCCTSVVAKHVPCCPDP